MGILSKMFSNTRKPVGKMGKMMAKSMNGSSHARMADWGMQYLPDGLTGIIETACDFGCGGGRNVGELLKKYPNANVKGFDYSEVSVETSKEYNVAEIERGRCEIIQGDVSNVTLPPESIDLATAFETIYFWPGLEKCFGEIYRTLKPGGTFLIVNEADGEDGKNEKWEKIIDMKTYTRTQIKAALKIIGFTDIEDFHHESKSWIAVRGVK